jgi:hypothetical protein
MGGTSANGMPRVHGDRPRRRHAECRHAGTTTASRKNFPMSKIASRVSGKIYRFRWTEGPTKGQVHEHLFHKDGTVEWHAVQADGASAPEAPSQTPKAERPPYLAVDVGEDVVLVSYRSPGSGFTLTLALNCFDESVVGVASSQDTWVPVKGRFEIGD